MKNIPLLIFDLLCLPITIIRLFLIYFFGSRYNIPSLQFLDVMNHATNKFFNQGQQDITLDTIPTDVRLSINRASRVDAELLNENVKTKINKQEDKIEDKQDIKNSIFGQKNGENSIVLRTEKNIPEYDVKKLQKLLPKILAQISLMNNHNDNINVSELDKKLDQEIMKELDFLSFNVEKEQEQDLQIFISEAN